jgi:hypothetical protein
LRTATRLTASIGVAVLMTATVVPAWTASASEVPPPDRTALILGGSTVPTPDQAYIDAVTNNLVGPTHTNEAIAYMPVTAPMEFWPIAGAFRVVWLIFGPPSVWGLDGPGWPKEPLWKLSGLFDQTFDQSVAHGVGDLEDAMADHSGEPLVIYGYSQGAVIANLERRKLAEQYPDGTDAPDIDFVLSGDPNTPNGGLAARFPGLYIPIVDFTFNGPAPTDTPFDTVVVNREYEAVGDFPLYPLNILSLVNSLLGLVYVHSRDLEVSLPTDDPTSSPAYQGSYGHTDYYLFESDDLPLFEPLRQLGVPEPFIDVVEPFFKVLVDLGYDRSIPPWQPTPARLFPTTLDPEKVVTDLVNAVGEGINNAAALIGLPPPLKIPGPDTSTVTALHSADADDGSGVGSPGKLADLNAVGDGISHAFSALNPLNKRAGTDENSGPQTPLGGLTKLTPKSLTDGMKFTPAKPTSTRDKQTGGPAAKRGANVNDTLQQVGKNVEKTVQKAADNVTRGLSGHKRPNVDSNK